MFLPPSLQAQPPQPPEQGKGVEMQEDFEGDLEDLPDGGEQGQQGSEADEQEDAGAEDRLDQTMGDVGDQGEVVDERLWGKDDKPEDPSAGKEELQSTKPLQVTIYLVGSPYRQSEWGRAPERCRAFRQLYLLTCIITSSGGIQTTEPRCLLRDVAISEAAPLPC